MYCRYCGKELPSDSNFCPNCGKKQEDNIAKGNSLLSLFFHNHKKILYLYGIWCLIIVGFILYSPPTRPIYNRVGREIGEEFDFFMLYLYIFLIPAAIFGFIKCLPFLSPIVKKVKIFFNHWQAGNAKRIKEYNANINAYTQPLAKEETISNLSDEPLVKVEPAIETVGIDAPHDNSKIVPTVAQGPNAEFQEEQPLTVEEVKKMPLFSRFVGSIIDKVLILIIFVVGSIIISPYGAPGRLGRYSGLLTVSPSNYEYIDRAAMNGYGTYNDGVSQYYQDRERLANDLPHIGSTMELDLSITFSFIIFNLLYYILFESIISASPGKRMLGGVLLDSSDDRIGFGNALIRAICGGALMALSVYLFRFGMLMSYYVVIIVFFLIIDIPVLFSKRSLIDILTGTKYAKR